MKKLVVALIMGLFVSVAYANKTPGDFVKEASKSVKNVTAKEAHTMLQKSGVIALDVRDCDELQEGKIAQSVHISRGTLEFVVLARIPNKNTSIVVFCKKGGRGILAVHTLQQMGYKNVVNMQGGMDSWKAQRLPVVK